MGYVPTPQAVIDGIRAMVSLPDGVVALDPCCGGGDALSAVCGTRARMYGIELDQSRAKEAQKRMARVLPCAMQNARISHGAFGFCLLNPPYDDSTDGRLEQLFIDRCTRYLREGGVMALIIPEYQFTNQAKRFLNTNFRVLGHWRFPPGYYDGPTLAFKQTLLIAVRDTTPRGDGKGKQILTYTDPVDWALPSTPLVTAPTGDTPAMFLVGEVSAEEIERLLSQSSISRKPAVAGVRNLNPPPAPLGSGHIALTLASGLIDGIYGQGAAGHVAKGTIVRTIKEENVEDMTMGGNPALIKKKTDTFAVVVRAIDKTGKIHNLSGGPIVPPDEDEKEAA